MDPGNSTVVEGIEPIWLAGRIIPRCPNYWIINDLGKLTTECRSYEVRISQGFATKAIVRCLILIIYTPKTRIPTP